MRYSFLSIVCFAIIVIGCDENDSIDSKAVGRKLVSIQASFDPETKTTVSIEGHVGTYSWTKGEQIAAFEATADAVTPFTILNVDEGLFIGEIEGSYHLIGGVSPLSAVTAFQASDGNVNYTLTLSGLYHVGQTNAILIASSFDSDHSVLLLTDYYKFRFRHAAGLMEVSYANVPVGTAGVRFTTNKPITGSVILETLTDVEIKNTDVSGKSESIVLYDNPVSNANSKGDFFFPIPTGTYEGFEIALIDSDGNAIPGTIRSMPTQYTVGRSDIIRIPTVSL